MKDLASDIAVIGMACRFPGAADPEQYWANLVAGRVSIGEVPETRWRWQDYRDESQPEESVPYCRWAGLIDDVDAFDAAFFNVSPREAESMDPQQRLGLELAWSCFEDAGMRPSRLSGRNVGVFLGFTNLDYKEIMEEAPIDIYYATGTLSSVISNRISYHFNLRGPSVAVDTACSSSLHALHLACRALLENECDTALAGGISLLLTPKRFIWYGKAGILSPTGAIRSFDENADGTVRGEGAGFLLLKPLERAIADGDRIVGVIKGSAVNHGGRHHTLTYPSAGAQAEVIAGALHAARVGPAELSYVECHGTGTRKGDPIEVQGLRKVLDRDGEGARCGLGCVKPNIGHLEGAAGIAGVIKVLLALRHNRLPPSVNLANVNSRIDLGGALYFVDRLQSWEPRVRDGVQLPRIAGVSSFGFAGTNAHVVLAEAPARNEENGVAAVDTVDRRSIVVLSARDSERLKERAGQLLQTIARRGLTDRDLPGIAYTLQVGREPMEERLGLLVSSMGELGEKVQAFLADETTAGLYRGRAQKSGELVSMLAGDEVFRGAVEKWVEQGRLEMLLELWIKGLDLDWGELHGAARPQPVGLPTYPFARTRYWAEPAAGRHEATNGVAAAALHPLLHSNTSDLSGQRFASTFTGTEFFLADHQVRIGEGAPQRVLPSVTYLEMARAAMERASAAWPEAAVLELRNTVWARPIVVDAETRVNIGLLPNDDDQIEYEIYTDDGNEEIVACQGRVVFSHQSGPVTLDIEQLEARMVRDTLDSNSIYTTFARMGLSYGPAFRVTTAVHRGEGELLAHLRLPDPVANTATAYTLHPSLMDGALQAAVVLDGDEDACEPRLPFALESLRIFSPCGREMVAWARYAPGSKVTDPVVKMDIDLCNERGEVCVQLHGFSSRVLSHQVGPATGHLFAAPVWRASAATPSSGGVEYAEHHVILCELPDADADELSALVPPARCLSLRVDGGKDIAERYEEHAIECFERIQTIFRRKAEGNVLFQVVIADHDEQTILAGLSGLLETARLENRRFVGQIVLVPVGVTVAELGRYLRDAKNGGVDPVIRHVDGARQVLRWEEIALDRETVPSPFDAHGVYLITGGLGGLGTLFAKEILERCPEARVVLTGRAELTPEKRLSLEALSAPGNRPSYRQVDLADRDRVERLIGAILGEHGKLNGILHCAGMIADRLIVKKDGAEFRRVLAPKVTGTRHLDLATRDVKLDFFLLFSSIAGALGNIGQADYAAANGFLDQFAVYRNHQVASGERHGRTQSINWPLWQAGGMGIDAAGRELLERTTGIQPMATATGLDAFHGGLASSYDRILVAEGDLTRIRRTLFAGPAAPSEPEAESLPAGAEIDSSPVAEKTRDYLLAEISAVLKLPVHDIDPQAGLDTYGIDSVLAMKLTNQLERTFGSLSKTLFFEYRTVGALTQYFLRSHAGRLASMFARKNDASRRSKPIAAPYASNLDAPAKRNRGKHAVRWHGPSIPNIEPEPIAIIGLSGRYPQATDVEAYWRNLRDGRNCIVEVPKERWDWCEYFTEDRGESGRHYSKWGGFIEGVDEFDPLFFNISPKEAKVLDPQERLFLQHAWMAVEDAGYTRASLEMPADRDLPRGVGVYAGVMYTEYQLLGAEASARGQRMGMAGSAASIANRVSYVLDLHGPSVTLDTMCSSSLTAIHYACEDLRRGRTAMAIAGGVNVSIHPNKYLLLSAGQFISGDGQCQSFGEGGDGYIPGEGVGAVVLKRLSEAKNDGDHIYGVIRGTALNHGGKTNGYTVPNPQAQASAIGRALADSHVDARHISYVEAHGTGTRLGDPIEIAALNEAFARYTTDTQFCLIGSAKSNIGHCESAAGVAGLTKVLLQMQHRQIVPSLHSTRLNPHVDFSSSPFIVNQTLRPWDPPVVAGRTLPRIAGISSFGAGGANAHLIVEEYQAPEPRTIAPADVAIVLSARTAAQLQQKVRDLLDFIRPRLDTIDLHALAYTLQTGREAMDERLGFVVSGMEDLAETLQAHLAGERNIDGLHQGQVKRDKRTVSLLSTDADLRETVDKWIADGKLSKLLELWVEGVELDWRKLHVETRPQRISLPVYPFARERYWIDVAPAIEVAPARAGATVVLHPLLHTNTSDFSRQSYSSTFSGEELFLRDQGTFPAEAYLEMACAAIRNAARTAEDDLVELCDVVWEQPAVVTRNTRIGIELVSDGGNQIDFEIFSQDADDAVHCRGRAFLRRRPKPRAIDLRRLSAESQLLVDLRLPETQEAGSSDYVLHPALLHEALQAGVALIDTGSPPFALDSLRLISPCHREMIAWVRHSPGSPTADDVVKLDLDLCDAKGNVAVEMRGAAWRRSAFREMPIAAAVERKRPARISLSAPGAPLEAASISPDRAPVMLAKPAATSPVRFLDEGNGILSIHLTDADNVASLLQALALVQQEGSLEALKVVGLERCFRRGGREDYNEALGQGLFRAIADFPYPVIAVLQGDTAGTAFLCAALCDLMVCNEDAIYRYTDAERQFYPTTAEVLLFSERFGEARAQDFLYVATASTGRELREKGWTCPIVPPARIDAATQRLVAALSTKSQETLRLLKQHLTRHRGGFVNALQRVDVPAPEAAETIDTTGLDSLGVPIQLNTPVEHVLVMTFDPVAVEDLVAALSAVSASTQYRAIVLVSNGPEFLPEAIAEDAVVELQRLIAGSAIPVVAALTGNARGDAWLISQFCDACVYSATGVYSAADVSRAAAPIFTRRLGGTAASEILFTGADYSGIDLGERTGTSIVAEQDQVVPAALKVAESWSKLPRATLTSWKKQTAAMLPSIPAAAPQTDDESEALPAIPTPIALRSTVVKATAHPEGIVVVRLEDRDAKNMFSEAFMAGVSEIFAHIEQTPAYKVVILTGYDQYFACGATEELLFAIHEGKIKFTDYNIYQLPLTCKLPVISAMQGHGIGAGWTLGMFADIVLLSEESRYVNPYMDYGFTPGDGATWVFAERVGHDLANESHLAALHYTGGELKERGLRLPVLPQAEVLPAAMTLARRIARAPRSRLAAIKDELTRHAPEELQETYRLEVALHDRIFVGRPDTLARILNNFHRPAAGVADGARHASFQALATTGSDALVTVTASLKTLLANELQMQERDADENLQFVDLGLDSVAGVSWVRKINEMYQTSIEAASIYSYPTLARFARHVQEEAEKRGTLDGLALPAPATTAEGEALSAVRASLKALLADELQMRESDVDENRQFVDLGLDSVAGVSWIRKINDKYQTAIDAAIIYSHPTLARLARHVTAEAERTGVSSRPVQTIEMREPVAPAPAAPTRLPRRGRPERRLISGSSSRRSSEPIAIIGMAGQFPEAFNLEEFWQNIAQGKNCIGQVPPHRWDVSAHYQPGDIVEGKTNCNWLGALADYDRFDPLFFNISPAEAESMDPQQRLFLQACWHSIEDAGYDARSLSGTKCGVFAGCAYGDYHLLSREQQLSAQGWTGDVTSILAARISYHLNLQGPCLSIDTACSSSLVAVAQACDSLVTGGSDLALAGGVYVMAGPEALIRATQSGMLSSAGRCASFDQRADGFVPGEGVGVVLLKRLADAERDRDIIHAVIHGWGVNQDGKTNGITAPNPESQIRLEQEVYDRYSIDPAQIQLVEAHGTGTKLGDPIEVLALKQSFGKYTREKAYCALGSVKSNIGHLSMAAGIAGFLKTVLALRHRQLPPTINFERLNEHIDLSDSPFYVNTRLKAWEPKDAMPRQAAVSAFGFSGTNAHVVVGEYPPPAEQSSSVAAVAPDGKIIVPLSAKRPEQLKQKARDLLAFLREGTHTADLVRIAYTLQVGREPMDVRVAFLVSTTGQLLAALDDYVEGRAGNPDIHEGPVKRHRESIDLLMHDAETREAVVAQWIAQKKFSKAVDWWVKGMELDWSRFYGEVKPRRVTLPGYPFARERYWIDVQPRSRALAGTATAVGAAGSAFIHPLLHADSSDPGERRYSSTFSGDEFFLADHHIKGEKVLPGVACLEMVRAAAGHAFPAWRHSGVLELCNTVWMKPIVVTGGKQINIALLTSDDDAVDFEIYGDDDGEIVIHCQGRAILSADPLPARLDLEQLERAMDLDSLEPDRLYAAFDRLGGVYGRSFRAITAIHLGQDQLLAPLRLPETVESTLPDYVLHPSLMDAALHGYPVLMEGWPDSNRPRMPFAVESVRVFAPCVPEMATWVRHAPGSKPADAVVKLDIDLCDSRGNVCVQMRGFSTRTLSDEPAKAKGSLLIAPMWQIEASAGSGMHDFAQHHTILCEPAAIDLRTLESSIPHSRCLPLQGATGQTIAQRYSDHAVACFERLQAILREKPQGKVLVQVVIVERDPEQTLFAGLSGLLKTAALENPQVVGQLIVVTPEMEVEELAARLREEQRGGLAPIVRYERGLRSVVRWQEVPATPDAPPIAFTDGGVYLITGGLGRLGVLFAGEILAQSRTSRVVLTGRSPLSAERRTLLESLSPDSGRVSYRPVDLADLDAVTQLVAGIAQDCGSLNGILHAAGMTADGFILTKTTAAFREVLEPKVIGTFNLDQAGRDVDLDFFAMFSSIASAVGNVGQADYAAANGFMDQFAAYRNRQVASGFRRGRTLAINWPLWEAGGMTADPDSVARQLRTTGMQPMQTPTGLEAFHRSIGSPHDQTLVAEGNLAQMRRALLAGPVAPSAIPVEPALAAASIDPASLLEKTEDYLCRQLTGALKLTAHEVDPRAPLVTYGIDSILAMKLTAGLEAIFGSLPKTLFFEYQTIRELTGYFIAEHAERLTALFTIPASERSATAPQVAREPRVEPASRRRSTRRGSAAPAATAESDPIAVIGLSGRYPGARDIDAFWRNLEDGKDCIIEVPAERWDWREYYNDDRTASGRHDSKWGGFIEGIDEFDPLFFNISPKEARYIDPQERLFLQQAWMAVEDAGYTRASLRTTQGQGLPGQVGVYAGVWSNEYQLFGAEASMQGERMGFAISVASIANRVSYALNLHGPSIALDTMCSASLTSIHMACQDLKLGRISLAIAGGVNVNLHPNKYLMLSAARAISTDGRCQSFGQGGDGYIPAEGVGVVVLKRLSEAERDGDHIYGIIRGSALNHGGRTNGYTVPNPHAQTDAIRRAMAEARVEPRHISYVETHGTGTRLGDPIEIAALNNAFHDSSRENESCCPIGSVKSNIGHCESAAGMAGLTKVLLQMQHQQLVPSLHSETVNPHIDFQNGPFVVNQSLRSWERPVIDGRTVPRIAGISSFGATGANAHMIVEEYQQPLQQREASGAVAILLSARTAAQLQQKARELLDFVRARSSAIDLPAVAYTLQVGREAMEERLGFVVRSAEQLTERLQAWVAGKQDVEDAYHGQVKRNREALSVFSIDADLQQMVDQWIANRKLSRLLDLWVKGLEVDWSKLYGEARPRRVSLPTYPFARERYWIDTAAGGPVEANDAAAGDLHEGTWRESGRPGSARVETLPEKATDPPVGLLTLAPVWEPVEVEAGEVTPRPGERVVVIGGPDEQHRALLRECGEAEVLNVDGRATVEELAEKLRGERRIDHVVWILPAAKQREGESETFIADQEEGALLGFRLIQALLGEGYGEGELRWTVITNATQRIAGKREQTVDAAHSSVHGLIGSMAKEYAKWKVRLVDVGPGAWPWAEMLRLGWDERERGWGYREGQWYRRRLVECEFGERESDKSGYRRGGVYVVIGGAGGLGEVLSDYLIGTYDARVVWIGRREKDEAIEKKQERVAARGGERPFYIVADARKREDLESACGQIKERYGRIDGVIHSTIVLAGMGLAGMTEEQFRAGLSAKVDVAVRLEQVFGREPLDFILYFSSVQSFVKAPVWSSYAAGCTFTDAFAEWQSGNVNYAVKVMNWGYWGTLGAVSATKDRERIERGGMGSLEPQEGMAGLERLLSGPLGQMGMLRIKRVELARALGVIPGEVTVADSNGLTRRKRAARKRPQEMHSGVVSLPAAPTKTFPASEEGDLGFPEKVEAWLVEAVGLLLNMKRDDIDVDVELSVFGFDSISLTDFASHVNQSFALELTPTIFYEHGTLRSFARYLVESHEERLLGNFIPQAQAGTTTPRKRLREAVTPKRGRAPLGATDVGGTPEEPEAKGSGAEPIAIIGMSGRFPGAEDLDAFWENLKAGKDSIREIPRERWDWRASYGDERDDGNRTSVKWGAFIEGVDEFDPLFFGISPREAEWMDPQQRLMMMYGWKAFEDAGYGPQQLWGSKTGIFIGTGNTGFNELLLTQARTGVEGHSVAGLVPSAGPGRLSYFLNLHGPSEPVETACSSSLVAVHRAVRAILGEECEMALVGGVNTLLTSTAHIGLSNAGMLSPDGKCKTFSSGADGYVRGEGVGMLVLKRLSAAERDRDHIYGVILGSAENHGGRGQSFTAPNPQLQAELIKDAYRRARVSPTSVSYIETHGTGTALGDPIEINGLKSAFQSLHEEMGEEAHSGYCGLGAVKSNIGHLEMAAGIAGLLKVLLQMQHRTLVPSLHCEELNPYIRLEDSPFYIVKEMQPWKHSMDGEPLRAGVSSFGFGGVNAHVVVEEYACGAGMETEPHGPVMVVLSARSEEALKERARLLWQAIGRRQLSDRDLVRLAYTLQVGREAMEHRLGLTAGSMQDLEAKLGAFVEGRAGIDGLYRGEVKRKSETLAALGGDDELREAVGKWMQRGKWSRVLELWVKGFPVEWEELYRKGKPRRLSLPTYPFAKERYWIDTATEGDMVGAATRSAAGAATAMLHPLLHRNTSDLNGQRYTSVFIGSECFLVDHRVRMNGSGPLKVLPGSAYLEMARAALEQASPDRDAPGVVDLRDTTWLEPVIVMEPAEISISLIPADDGDVDYEIYSVDGEQETTHCRGRAVLGHACAPEALDLDRLAAEMKRGRLEAAEIYALFEQMGLRYGPSHRGIAAMELGEGQSLAHLRLPAAVEASRREYVLHPGLLDSALQASVGLFAGDNRTLNKPLVPFMLDSLRVLAACTAEMFVWVRYAEGTSSDAAGKVDIDVCDEQGNVCIQMRGFTTRDMQGRGRSPAREAVPTSMSARLPIKKQDSSFDREFYRKLIADIVNNRVTVDEAVRRN